jgi:hypothetical protein
MDHTLDSVPGMLLSSIASETYHILLSSITWDDIRMCALLYIEFDPAEENLRKESKISVPDRNVEPAVATTPGQDYINKKVEIRHE